MVKRLLIITQKVDKNDDVLGFFHRWIEEFSKHAERVDVICLWEGEHDFNSERWCASSKHTNTTVYSLGKERQFSKIKQLVRFWTFCGRLVSQTDGVFVHMNPIYAVLGSPFFKFLKKPVVLWYSHRDITLLLRFAHVIAQKVLSVSQEGFRLKSKKVSFVGHGIDAEFFSPAVTEHQGARIVSVGRISPIKNLDTLILAVDQVRRNVPGIHLKIVGEAVYDTDKAYLKKLRAMATERNLSDHVSFPGRIAYLQMPTLYRESDIAVNLAPHGGADKAVLEAMASGITVLASNKTFRDDLGIYADRLIFQERNTIDLAKKLDDICRAPDRAQVGMYLRQRVMERHDLSRLIKKIVEYFL